MTNSADLLGTFISMNTVWIHCTVKCFAESGLTYEIGSKWKAFSGKQLKKQKIHVFAMYFIFDQLTCQKLGAKFKN